ncbi:MAG: hypothetical protein JSR54_14740 [Proteobacteria bacterium]|nr:hypothetical protein [Pseudomonadota bacterium]
MGYELESPVARGGPDPAEDERYRALERHWRLANERLAVAISGCHALRGHVARGEEAWVAAQLRLAQARQRCREVADEVERLALERRLTGLR